MKKILTAIFLIFFTSLSIQAASVFEGGVSAEGTGLNGNKHNRIIDRLFPKKDIPQKPTRKDILNSIPA